MRKRSPFHPCIKAGRIKPARLEHLVSLLESWRRQTKYERIRCQRHHLKFEVLHPFTQIEKAAAVAWAIIGREDVPPVFDEAFKAVKAQLETRDVLDVIAEFRQIEKFIMEGLRLVAEADGPKPAAIVPIESVAVTEHPTAA